MATTKELIEFLKLQAAQNTYEDVQGEEESPADCGNYDDAYDMGRLSGKIAFAKALVGWLEGGPKPVLETGFERDEDEEEDDGSDFEDEDDEEDA